MRRAVVRALAAVAVVVVAVGASFALLGYATTGSEPVGNLSPQASLPHTHAAVRHTKVRLVHRRPRPTRSTERELPDD